MYRTVPKRIVLLILACIATMMIPAVAYTQDDSPFGLRNISLLSNWDETEFESEFAGHKAGRVAFWTFWGDIEPSPPVPEGAPPTYQMATLHDRLLMCAEVEAEPVIVFHLTLNTGAAVWAMEYPFQNGVIGPIDLTFPPEPVPSCPDPTQSYSPRLYGVSYAMAEEVISTLGSGRVWMRFHNEPWDEWSLGSLPNQNTYRYLLSYLTFRRAFLDAQAAQVGTGVTFQISHGSIPRTRQAVRRIYDENSMGLPSEQQDVADLFDSWIERSRCRIGGLFPGLASGPGQPASIQDWGDATIYADPTQEDNQRHDIWLDRFIEWTANCSEGPNPIFDFTNTHPHGKLAPIYHDIVHFDQAVIDADGTPLPWVGSEVGFQLTDQENWAVHPIPGSNLDNFIGEDLARKWCMLAHEFEFFCSPLLAGYPNFRGLYRKQGSAQPRTGCPYGGFEDPAGTDCTSFPSNPAATSICEDKANEAYLYLSGLLGRATTSSRLSTVEDSYTHYRYFLVDGVVDALWRNELYDSTATTSTVPISGPAGYVGAEIFDVYGTKVGGTALTPGGFKVKQLGQPPRILVWHSGPQGF